MTVEQLRAEVDELMSRPPLPAPELSKLPSTLVPALSWGAISHPNAAVRRNCLDWLDHIAVADSAEVFLAALEDPVPECVAMRSMP